MSHTRVGLLPPCSRFVIAALVGAAVVVVTQRPGHAAEADQVNVLELKAAFIVNFLRFVDWPPEHVPASDRPYVVAVLSDRDLERAVRAASAGQNVEGRGIAVRAVSSVDEAGDAHLLFIGGTEERRLGSLVQQLSGQQVLTVGDTPGYGQAGVMLNLFVANQRVQFEANTTAASRAGIQLRSSLLRLARIVG